MEVMIILVLINAMVYGLALYLHDEYEMIVPLFMSLLIFVLSFCLGAMKLETRIYENECMLCSEITYSEDKKEIYICDDCNGLIRELKEREDK